MRTGFVTRIALSVGLVLTAGAAGQQLDDSLPTNNTYYPIVGVPYTTKIRFAPVAPATSITSVAFTGTVPANLTTSTTLGLSMGRAEIRLEFTPDASQIGIVSVDVQAIGNDPANPTGSTTTLMFDVAECFSDADFANWNQAPHHLHPEPSSGDLFFVIAMTGPGINGVGIPSTNEHGDVVSRFFTSSGQRVRVFLDDDQRAGSTESNATTSFIDALSLSSGLAAFPVMNDAKDVSTYRISSGIQSVRRLEFVGPPQCPCYSQTFIARADPVQSIHPFSFLSPLTAIDGMQNVLFYGERTPFLSPQVDAIYQENSTLSFPAAAIPVVSTGGFFSEIDAYVAVSENGNSVYRGTGSQGLGIYTGSSNAPVATPTNGFMVTGRRPGTNDAGTIAFYGAGPAGEGVFIKLTGEVNPRRAGDIGMTPSQVCGATPTTASDFLRIAINEFNQVAYVGTSDNSIYTTTLGRSRRLIGEGDKISLTTNGNTTVTQTLDVTSVGLHDGMGGENGHIVFSVGTQQGVSLLVRSDRAYRQSWTPNSPSPIKPSYRGTNYLLRAIPNSCYSANRSIGRFGCNLTSTANILTAFGFEVSPIELQDWLIQRYRENPSQRGRNICTSRKDSNGDWTGNDPNEYFVNDYTRSRNVGRTVAYRGIHKRSAAMTNQNAIVAQLRAGNPVKLRVPSYDAAGVLKRFGHYVIAYALKDPSATSPGLADILIHDPASRANFDLASYAPVYQDWLEDEGADPNRRIGRVYLYESAPCPTPTSPVTSGLATSLGIRIAGTVDAVIRNSAGDRLGYDPATGAFDEIPGSRHLIEYSYLSVDTLGLPPETAWGDSDPVTQLFIDGAAPDTYTVELIGQADSEFSVDIAGSGLDFPNTTEQGYIRTGERIVLNITATNSAAAPTLILAGASSIGSTQTIDIASPDEPMTGYAVGLSGGNTGIEIDTRTIPLRDDHVLRLTLQSSLPSLVDFTGILDAQGCASARLRIPNEPSIVGQTLWAAFVTLDPMAPSGISQISSSTSFTIAP